jgi:hypothetical protein
MTRKDSILIAGAMHSARILYGSNSGQKAVWQEAVDHAALHIAGRLEDDDPQFDAKYFLAVVRGEKALTSRPARS